MRPIDSSYDNSMASGTVTPETISESMVWMITPDDHFLIWASEEASEDDDGASALRTSGFPADIDGIREIMLESAASEL